MRSINIILTTALIAVVITINRIEASHDENLFCEQDFENVTLCTNITDKKIEDPCRDNNDQCDFWASEGECPKNPNYMLVHCAKSCKECAPISSSDGEVHDHDNIIDDTLNKRSDLDVEQEITYGRTKDERKKTYEYSQKMDEYRKSLFQHPSTTPKTLKLCINELSKCAYYASLGLCEERVIFMLETCPLACMMCDKKEQFDKCVGMRHPFDTPIFVSDREYEIYMNDEAAAYPSNNDQAKSKVTKQTVNSFFQSKKDDSRWVVDHGAEYVHDPKKHKNGDSSWVVKLDNVISSEQCQSIIDIGNTIGWDDFSSETEDTLSFKPKVKEAQKYFFKTAKCASANIKCDEYAPISSIQEVISDLTQIPLDYFESPEILLFPESNGGYQSLQHNYDIHDEWKILGPKVLSFYIPLSSVEVGGYTGFPSLDWLMIQLEAGQMLLWSNVMSDNPNAMNKKMANEVLPVQKGDLYVLRIHVRQYGHVSATARGYKHCI